MRNVGQEQKMETGAQVEMTKIIAGRILPIRFAGANISSPPPTTTDDDMISDERHLIPLCMSAGRPRKRNSQISIFNSIVCLFE